MNIRRSLAKRLLEGGFNLINFSYNLCPSLITEKKSPIEYDASIINRLQPKTCPVCSKSNMICLGLVRPNPKAIFNYTHKNIILNYPNAPLLFCPHCHSLSTPHYQKDEKGIESRGISWHLSVEQRNRQHGLRQLQALIQISKRPIKRMIEIGCGAGWMLDEAEKLGIKSIGYETNTDCVEYAQKTLNLDVRLNYFSEAIEEKCDLICAFSVLEHMVEPNILLHSIAKVAKRNNALVAIAVPVHTMQFLTYLGNTFTPEGANPLYLYPIHVTHFTREGLNMLIRKFGGHDIRFLQNGGLWPGVSCLF